MKTIVTIKQNLLKSVLFIIITTSAIAANASASPLSATPAKPTSFTAVVNSANNSKVDLKWSTETESNLSHFIVERSIDGINYNNAALVFAYGNTNSKSDYFFPDNISKVKPGVVYYRISSIGTDGNNQYSDILIIRTDK